MSPPFFVVASGSFQVRPGALNFNEIEERTAHPLNGSPESTATSAPLGSTLGAVVHFKSLEFIGAVIVWASAKTVPATNRQSDNPSCLMGDLRVEVA
jgi:hypothetical protein